MTDTVNELIIANIDLANKMARKSQSKYPKFSFDELQAAAFMGLVESANKFDNTLNVKFSTFASTKIKYSILDYVLESSVINNPEKKKIVFVELQEETVSVKPENTNRHEIYEIITNDLQLKEKEIFLDYYVNDRKMHEIANDHNVHESRISQILKKVIQKINMKWSGNRSELYDIAA